MEHTSKLWNWRKQRQYWTIHHNMELKNKFCTAEQETVLHKRVNSPHNTNKRIKMVHDWRQPHDWWMLRMAALILLQSKSIIFIQFSKSPISYKCNWTWMLQQQQLAHGLNWNFCERIIQNRRNGIWLITWSQHSSFRCFFISYYLQDRVDLVGGGQPLVSLPPVARDGAEQRAGLELNPLLVDEELLHPAIDRVHEQISDPRRASQGALLRSLCARERAWRKMGSIICSVCHLGRAAEETAMAAGGVPVCWRWRRNWRWCWCTIWRSASSSSCFPPAAAASGLAPSIPSQSPPFAGAVPPSFTFFFFGERDSTSSRKDGPS